MKISHPGDILPSQSRRLIMKKLNLTQENQTHISKPTDTITQNKQTKTKPIFDSLIQCLASKQNVSAWGNKIKPNNANLHILDNSILHQVQSPV